MIDEGAGVTWLANNWKPLLGVLLLFLAAAAGGHEGGVWTPPGRHAGTSTRSRIRRPLQPSKPGSARRNSAANFR